MRRYIANRAKYRRNLVLLYYLFNQALSNKYLRYVERIKRREADAIIVLS